MEVEKEAGSYIGGGIALTVLGGAIVFGSWLSELSQSSYRSGEGPLVLGGILALIGLGLLITGIAKVARNIEIAAIANVSAEDHLRKTEEHLRSIRWVVATQYNEERGLTFKSTE